MRVVRCSERLECSTLERSATGHQLAADKRADTCHRSTSRDRPWADELILHDPIRMPNRRPPSHRPRLSAASEAVAEADTLLVNALLVPVCRRSRALQPPNTLHLP